MGLKLTIRDRENLIYDDECGSVTSFNDVGEFDVLEGHANFITFISKFVVINKSKSDEQKIPIGKGILGAKDNSVEVYLQD